MGGLSLMTMPVTFGFIEPVEHFRINHPVVFAGLTGLVSGFIISIPVGPVNLTIVNEGARRGLKWAALIGAGAGLIPG